MSLSKCSTGWRGEIPEFTGVSAPYETPENSELEIDTGTMAVEECLRILEDYVESNFGL
ncbi:MAG TPA: adenylyl-sulfate kinase [Rhodospirillales bacterium]|jgi:adenylylsulfate kinase-like enzyme|nr:adenylyl-sulfate kinase [Rhodospirillales bacterium]